MLTHAPQPLARFDRIETWAEDLVTDIDLEHLVRLRTGMGSDKVRFDSLDDERRIECLASASPFFAFG